MHPRTRAFLNGQALRLSATDHALQHQLNQPMDSRAARPWLRRVARVFTSLFMVQTLLAGMPAYAQLTAAPGAPAGHKPLIDAAANGTPIVLIAPPSKAGVSRNQYEQFNVGPKGLILNNSTGNVQTQIGGWISGNLQLGLTPARIILNEVTGPNASQLRGTIEVGGQRADIVIANPNGITCDGCGFLNSDRATLTTGTPRFGTDGAVSGFDVRQGVIQIGPDGLNATEQQQLELHARGLVIEGEVYSQNLQAVIGANQIVYGTLHALPQATAQEGTGEAPRFAVDIKALGGMYAGQIYLIATDKGLGVNSTGRAATLAGNLVLSASGDLTLKDTYASANIQLASAGLTMLTGQTLAEGGVTIESAQQLTNSGAMQAPTLQLNAPALHNSGSIAQTKAGANLALTLPGGLQNSGQIYTPGNLTVQAGAVSSAGGNTTATGQLAAGGSLQVAATSLQLTGQQLAANGDVTLDASGKLDVTGTTVSANGQARLAGSEIALERARIAAMGNVQIASQGWVMANAADISSNATLSVQGSRVDVSAATMTAVVTASIKADGEIKLDGSQLAAGQRVALQGQGISTPGATVSADKITLDAGTGALTNPGGKILASSADGDALTVKATGITNTGGELRANGGLVLDARGGVIDNTAGVIAGTTGALTNLGGLTNKGGLLSTQSDLTLTSTALDNSEGAIITAGSLTVSTPGQTINNTKGVMQAGGAVSLDGAGADLKNAGGAVVAGTALTVQAGTVETAAGTLVSKGEMTVTANQLQAPGATLGSDGAMNIAATGNVNLGTANVGAGSDLAIRGDTVQAGGANVASNANLQIAGGSITGGNWSAQGNLTATSQGALNVTGGSLLAGGNLTAQGQGITTDGARLAGQDVTLNAGTGALSNVGGQIHARGNLQVQASQLVNRGGTVATGGALALQGAALDNHAGTLQATGNLSIHTAGQALDNTAGKIISGGNTTVQAGALSNSGGTISAGGTAHVQAAALNTAQGQISGTRQLDILVTQRLTAVGATLGTEGKFTASAADIDAQAVTITAGETLGVTAGNGVDVRGGTVKSLQALSVQTHAALAADGATIRSGDTVQLTAHGISAGAAQIGALNHVTLNAGAGDFTAPAVLVQSENGGISLSAAAVNVASSAPAGGTPTTGLLAGQGIAITATGAVDISGAATNAATDVTIATQGSITNNAGRLIAGTQASLAGATLNNQGGMVDANGAIIVSITNGQVNNDQGRISTRDVLTMSVPGAAGAGPLTSLSNAGGVIETTGALNAQLHNFNNEGGSVVALAGLTIAGGPVTNTGGQLASQGNVSVNTQGGAFSGDSGKVLSTQGNIVLTMGAAALNNAQLLAGQDIALTASGAVAADRAVMAAGGDAGITATQGIAVNGGSVSAQTISLDAGSGALNNTAANLTARATTGMAMTLQGQGLNNDGGTIASSADLNLNAGAGGLSNAAGQILAVGAADIRATGLNNVVGTIASNGNLTINAAQANASAATDSTGGTLQSGQNITLTAGATTLTSATVTSGGNTTLSTAALLASQARINALGDFSATATGAVVAEQITIAAGGAAAVDATQGIDLTRGSIRASTIDLNAGGVLNNNAGHILAVGAADIRSTGLYNVGGTIASNGNLTINAAQVHANAATDSTGGTLQSGQNITLTAGNTTLTNATVTSGGNTTLSTVALQANQARINALGNFSATSSAAVTAQQLALAAGGSAAITAAQGIDLSHGSVSAQTINVNAGGVLNNTSGNLTASAPTGTGLTLQSQGLVNDQGTIASNAGLSINAYTGSVSNTGGRVLALGAADVRSTGLANVGGTLASNGDLTINAAQAHANAATDSTGGTLQSGQNITLTAGATTLTNATVTSGGNTTLDTGTLQASQARINALGDFTATSSGAVTADQVALAAGGSAAITAAQGIDVNRGTVSAQTVNLNAGGVLNNNAGSILALGAADIRSTGLYNVGGTIASNGNLTINAAQANANAATDSTGGTLQSGQNITLTAGATTLTNATVTSGGNTTLNTGALQASQARINVLGDFSATSTGAVTADRVAVAAGGSAVITAAQGIDVNRGSVSAQTINLDAGGGVLNNNVGSILAVGATDIRSTGLNNVGGTIAANGHLTINAAQAHANAATDSTSGTLQSGQNITLTAGSTTLTNATVTSGGNTTLHTGALQADQARINAGGNFSATTSAAVTAQQLALAAGGSAAITATQGIDLSQGSVSAQTIALSAGGLVNNTGGNLHAGTTTGTALTLQSQGLVNDQGTIASNAGLSIQANAGSVSNAAGSVLALGAADVRSTGLNNAAGTIASNGDLTINTVQAHANAATDSTGGALQSGQNITLTAGSTTLTNATVTSGGHTTLTTGALQASQARINALGNFTATSSGAVTADRLALAASGNVAITATQGIDVNRGTVSAQTVNLNAGSGTLNNHAGSIQAVGALDIRSTGLNNRAGAIASNGDLTLNAALANALATLDSTDGAIRSAQAIALTAGATTLTRATVTSGGNTALNTGALQASQVRINVGGDLAANASGALNNNAGSILVTGAADIRSNGLTNVDGTIAANGAMTVNADQAHTASETNNTRGTIRSAQASVTLTTGALDNTRADISAGNDVQITATGALTNDQARIVAGRDAVVSASAIGNTDGLIAGNRDTSITAGAGGVTNTSGTIQASHNLAVTSAGDVANTSGKLLAGNQLALTGAALTNSQGQIGAQTGSVTLTVTSYTNTGGSVVAGSALTLDTQGGALTANGATFASGADMTLRAGAAQLNDAAITSGGSIAAQATSLQAAHANVQAAGNLTATAGAGAFNAANSTWQAGQAIALTGGAVVVADATVSANTTVAVTGASVEATRASITSPGDVSVVAANGALNITNASLLAGRDLTATGTGAGSSTGAQALAGRDLTLGNGTAFDFAAAGLQYQFGRDLTVRAQGISTAGQQVSARNLTLDAGSGQLNNQGGTLQATGTLTASGTGLNNQNGVIAANGQVTAGAGTGTLNNAGGQIYSTLGATIVSGATIANVTGTISAATDVSITGGTLNNAGNTIAAGRNLTATLSGVVNNAGGRLIANTGAASVTANGIDNQGGTISGTTSTTADAGSGMLSNTGGLVTGQNVSIGGEVNNSAGVISGGNSVTLTTRAIDNDGGVIESGAGGISINTQGHALTNTHSGSTRGIVSQGSITIAAGDINNQAGYVGANGSLSITQSGTIHNQSGTLLGLGGVSVTTGTLNNQGGSVLSGGDATVNAGTVNNGGAGTIYAARDLTVNANSIDNSHTRNGGYTTGLLAGRNASITAATITNTNGAIVALGDATVRATSSLNNTQGQISGNTVTIQTPSLTNTAGRADAQQRMTVQVPQFSADGVLASNGAMNLELQGNYVNTGVVSASGDLNISTTGSYTNLNRVSAQNSLSLTAAGIDNAANATIDSQRTTLNASGGTINNAGTINSTAGQTTINAGTLNNTGKIYGDSIALNANVNNSAAAGNGAAIATRGGDVTINGALNNTDDGLVLSLGNITVNGSTRNDGSTINAMGNVTITGPLTNTHVGMQTSSQTRTEPAHAVYITPSGSTTRYNVGDLAWTGHTGGHWVLPSTTYPLWRFGADPKAPAMQCGHVGGDAGNYECNPGYGLYDPIWSLMGVASPGAGPGTIPMECMDFGGETGNAQRVYTGGCGGYWASYDAYTVSVSNSYANLDAAITAFNTDLNARTLIDWYETTITGTTITETTAVPGRAAKVLAGGSINIGGGSNIDSVIVAGGSLNGGAINNVATQGTRQTSTNGYYVFSHRTWSGGFSSSYGRETSAPQPIADAPVTQTLNLPVLQYQGSGSPEAPGAGGNSTPLGGAAASVVGVGRNIGSARNADPAGTANAAVQTGAPTTGTGAAVQVNTTTTGQAQSAPAVNGVQAAGGSAVTTGAGNTPMGNTPTGHTAVTTGAGAGPTAGGSVTAGANPSGNTTVTGANPAGSPVLSAGTGNTATAGTAVTAGTGSSPASAVQVTSGSTGPITASLSAAPDAALPGSVIAAGVRAGQLAAITTSLTNFAANAAIQPPQAQSVDTSARTSTPATVKAAGYTTVRASGAVRAPGNQLFSINRNPRAPLVETDPAFTGYRTWISSAYMLQQLAINPERNLKLYGDGFAEQRLIDDQILALTGRRFLSGYQSTEDQYHDLMDSGVMFAREFQLTPGVALSAQQMALLTTDIVWLEERTVTLPDGSTTTALVPTVYLRRPTSGDLTPTGALIAGSNVTLRSPGDLTNTGTIVANGDAANGDGRLTVTGQNVTNSGTMAGNQIAITADDTLNNTGGVVQGLGAGSSASLNARDIILRTTVQSSTASIQGPNGESTGTRTNADRIATVSADSVKIAALNNINLASANITATGNLAMAAGGNVISEALQTGYTLNAPLGGSNSGRTGYISEVAVTQQLGNISGNNVAINATGDASFKGTNLTAVNNLAVTAKTITIDAVKESLALDQQGIGKKGYERVATSDETLAGANVTAGNNVTLNATGGNINATGSTIIATNGAAAMIATGDVNLNAAATQHSTLAESFNASKGFLSSKSSLRESGTQTTLAEGSSVSGKTVAILAGQDINVKGSSVVSDMQTTLSAGRNVNITAATETQTSSSFTEDKKSGLGAMGGISFGTREQSAENDTTATRAVASNIASLQGNVSISAGQAYRQVGSNVLAPVGNVDITAKTVSITEARETTTSEAEQKFKQSGISVNATGAIASAIHTIDSLAEQAGKAKDGRMQSLAVLAGAVEAKKALDGLEALAKDPTNLAGVGISISLGSQKNQSNTQSQSNTAAGSTVAAGGNVTITAQGAGDNSNITVQGSNISAANTTSLKADGQVNLLAAQNTSEQHSQNSGSSASIGVGITFGEKTGISFNASASTNKGKSDGSDLTHTNTQVSGGQVVNIQSGGDTTIKGAVVSANTVNANVGGDLKIESLQDSAKFDEKQTHAGFGATLCIPPLCVGASSATVSAGKTTINSNYQSVGEQSGIKAGDGGFNVNVLGATDLKGGVISSTDKALQDGKNSFASAGGVTLTDIQNVADYKAGGFSVTAGYSGAPQDGSGNPVKDNAGNVIGGKPIGGGGFGSEKGSASSITQAGISGIAGNTAARTGDAETGIKPIFNAAEVRDNVNAQISITSTALPIVAKGWADYANEQERTATTAQDKACWAEGGACRVAGHVAIGALAGGTAGAAGAGASQAIVATIGDALKDTNLPDTVKQTIVAGLGAAVGAAAGGTAGAVTGGNATVNNYLTQAQWKAMADERAKCADKTCRDGVDSRYAGISASQDQALRQACTDLNSANCRTLVSQAVSGGATQQDLVAKGTLPDNYLAGRDFNSNVNLFVQKVQAQDVVNACNANPAQCDRDRLVGSARLLLTTAAIAATVAVAPALLKEVGVMLSMGVGEYCTVRAQSCLNIVNAAAEVASGVPVSGVNVPGSGGRSIGNLEPGNSNSTSIVRNGTRLLINQGNLPTCGPVSCAMVLNTAGIEVDLATVILQSKVGPNGTTMPQLVNVLNSNGLPTQRVLGATIEDLAAATASGNPAIVRMSLDRGGHAVVVDGITVRNGIPVVAIRDPALGRQYFTPVDEFARSFSGEAAFTGIPK